ncbi:hypothetical protein KAI58_02455 [Candidatus Gracilibacteria bacterium]|nr:hypothetical protein [Candidatus Gracilibacteria bacterium]
MKNLFFTQFKTNTSSQKLVFLNTGDPLDADINPDILTAPGRINPESKEQFETDQQEIQELHVGGALHYFRENASRGGAGYRIDDPMGAFPDAEKAFWNPRLWWRILLNSKAPVLDVLQHSMQIPQFNYQNSQYNYSRIDGAILNQTLQPTLKSIKKSGVNPKTCSLSAINHWSITSKKIFAEILKEGESAKEELLPKLDTQENWKKILKFIFPFQKKRLKFLFEKQLNSIKQGQKETQQILDSLQLQRERHLENIHNAGIKNFLKQTQLAGDDAQQENFWKLISEITQNPEKFIQNPQTQYAGIDWQSVFKTKSPTDFLETLKHYGYTDKVISMQNLDRLDRDASLEVNRFNERTETVKTQIQDTDFQEILNALYTQSIELAPSDTNLDAKKVVSHLQEALVQIQPGINLEQDIYQNSSINRLTPEEKFIYFIRYFQTHLDILENLNDKTKQFLLRYLFDRNNETKSLFATGGLSENATLDNQKLSLRIARLVVESADRVFQSLPNLGTILKGQDGEATQNALRSLEQPVIYYDQLLAFLGITSLSSEETRASGLFSKLPEPQQKAILNLSKYKAFIENIKNKIEPLKQERIDFETNVLDKLPPRESAYQENRDQFNRLQEQISQSLNIDDESSREESLRTVQQNAANLLRTQGGQFSVLGGQFETRASNLQQLATQIRDILAEWDRARAALAGQSFTNLPSNVSELGEFLTRRISSIIKNEQQDIGDIYEDNIIPPELSQPQISSMNERLGRFFNEAISNRMENSFLSSHTKNIQQQWTDLKQKPIGYMLDHFEFSNVTHQDGKFNLSGALSHISNLQAGNRTLPLRLIKNEENCLIWETSHHIIELKAPSGSSGKTENISNIRIWNKTPEEIGPLDQNKPFRVPNTNADISGIWITAGPKNPHVSTQVQEKTNLNQEIRPHPRQQQFSI